MTERARGAGVGTALVAEAVRRFDAAGCGEVRVVTDADNLAAIRVYEKAGIGGDLDRLHRTSVPSRTPDADMIVRLRPATAADQASHQMLDEASHWGRRPTRRDRRWPRRWPRTW